MQTERLSTAGDYKERGGHLEPKGMIGPGRKQAPLHQKSIEGGVVIRNLKG